MDQSASDSREAEIDFSTKNARIASVLAARQSKDVDTSTILLGSVASSVPEQRKA